MRIKAHIFLIGCIGDPGMFSYEPFFTVNDVRNHIQNNSEAEELIVHITTQGGRVDDAFAMHDLLTTSGKKITTIGEGMVASSGTILLLSGTKRQLTKYSRVMIHNPYGSVEGDADQLQKAADEMQRCEERIQGFYADKTGTPASKFDKWMKEEKYMDADEALELGFVTEILEPVKAVALIHTTNSQNQNSLLMDFLLEAKKTLLEIKNQVFGAPKNLDLTDATGKKVVVETAKAEAEVGDPCSIDNQPAADGDLIIPAMNKTLVISNGKISEIKEVAAATDPEPAADPSKNVETEAVNKLKKELEAVNVKNGELEAKLKTQETDIKGLYEGIVEIKGHIKSNYKPGERNTTFNKAGEKKETGEEVDRVAEGKRKRLEREAAAKK